MTRVLRLTTFSRPSTLLAAQHRGFLESAGLALEVEDANGSRPQMEGMIAGQWDIAHTNADNIMKFRAAGHTELFIFVVLERGIAQKVIVQPSINGWEDLRGGAVGVDASDSGYAFVLYELLRLHGVEPGAYEVKSFGATGFRLQALQRGEINAALLSHHHEATAVDEGFKVLTDLHEHFRDHPGLTAATTHSWAERNEEVLHSYTAALVAAAAWAHAPENHEDIVQLISQARGIDEGRARRVLDIEKSGRTGAISSIRGVEDSLAATAVLRAQFTGVQPTGYFDPAALSKAL